MFDVDLSTYVDPAMPFELNPTQHWKNPEKILVINASPRATKGYTYFYLQPFLKGLSSNKNKIEICNLNEYKIKSCIGCWQCWLSDTGQCILNNQDDYQRIHIKYENADIVIFAFPLYVDGIPGILKNFLDRNVASAYPYMINGLYKTRHPRRIKKQKSLVIFSTCGFLEIENFNAVKQHFRQISHNNHNPIIAEFFRSGAMYLYNNPTLFKQLNEILQALEKAGQEIFEKGKISRKNQKIIAKKIQKKDVFHKESNYFWHEKISN